MLLVEVSKRQNDTNQQRNEEGELGSGLKQWSLAGLIGDRRCHPTLEYWKKWHHLTLQGNPTGLPAG